MTTTTTYQGMEPNAKNSSRVLRPPGGSSNISFGSDESKTPARKDKMASSVFAEPEDPYANRRNNPPGGKPTGVLCGESSAPLRRGAVNSADAPLLVKVICLVMSTKEKKPHGNFYLIYTLFRNIVIIIYMAASTDLLCTIMDTSLMIPPHCSKWQDGKIQTGSEIHNLFLFTFFPLAKSTSKEIVGMFVIVTLDVPHDIIN
ncbi:jupiter microtubule associated homolog 1a isoform X1 [Syngnathus acus]|uniref:jupiter microtubule associated homolog 1a isoform X1 n=1 Tax=Syngnathus acus TaxID=161584 RepID=UPI0018864775|nr:jupiter microtubule associated homolog 1a isoform X1 [Syngnathus acus]